MGKRKIVDPKTLLPGPIRHGSLPPDLLDQIKAIFDMIGPYIGMTLEQWEIGFMRDAHPEREVAVWGSITAAWLAYHEQFVRENTLAEEEEGKLLGALIAISTGINDVTKLKVPADVGRKLLQCFRDLGKK